MSNYGFFNFKGAGVLGFGSILCPPPVTLYTRAKSRPAKKIPTLHTERVGIFLAGRDFARTKSRLRNREATASRSRGLAIAKPINLTPLT